MKRLVLALIFVAIAIGSGIALRGEPGSFDLADATNDSSVVPWSMETLTPTPSVRPPLSLVFVGDLMFDRSVWNKMVVAGHDYPFAKIENLFENADLLIGNLEGPITERGKHATPGGVLLFKFEPLVAQLLRNQGFDLLSLANNHTLNQGLSGLADTEAALESVGITSFGHPQVVTGDNVRIIEAKGWKIAFVGWNMIEVPDTHEAELLALVAALDPTVDAVIVMPHWGTEYRPQAKAQVAAAHALIDAGADLIIGAHPHTVQGVEIYANRFIAYSLGNFIFDQYWSDPTEQGLALCVGLSENNLEVEFRPVDLRASQPRPANANIAQAIITRLLDATELPNDIEQRIVSERRLSISWAE